ncbi:MAG TPA: tetratricopeptide repeat protein, partial [Candidatus Hydrogenedentes bacterium]|nr:tetratricopeptide repeat protein [Candidatus Hydrogenedentota bacterium]
LNNLDETLRNLGRGDEALAWYDRALAALPDNGDILNSLGWHHYMSGNLEEAERCFRKALEAIPSFPLACNNLGNVLLDRGDAAGALDMFERARKIYDQDSYAAFNEGRALLALGRVEDAEQRFAQSLEVLSDPKEKAARAVAIGNLMQEKGLTPAAEKWYKRAAALDPESAQKEQS